MKDSIPPSPVSQVTPDCIAAGIGLADRRELCGLLALFDATGAVQLAQGALSAAQRKLGIEASEASARLGRVAEELHNSSLPTDALRHRLWFEIASSLGVDAPLPLSVRRMREAASAVGVLVARHLKKPAPQIEPLDEPSGWRELGFVKSLARRVTGSSEEVVMSFPEVVTAELDALLKGLSAASQDGSADPAIVAAIRSGQTAMAAAVASGGGWAAFAAAVGSAGFAPYIIAAQLSAFIPFVSGPALVSVLAVMINPVTLVVGGALGVLAINKQAGSIRVTVASRVAVLLAVRGVAGPEAGIAALVSAFRSLPRYAYADLQHLSRQQLSRVRAKHATMEQRLARQLPPAQGIPPGRWGEPLHARDSRLDVDTAAVASLTIGDMMFHAIAVDPAVLAAADFSRTLDLSTPLDLAAHISAFASKGAFVSLRGFSAEQIVRARLLEDGHSVALPESSTMKGFDLIVDGEPVQVKCGLSLALLDEHFAKYPDIPVIADNALAALAAAAAKPWSQQVTTVDGFDLETVEKVVAESLSSAEGLATPDIPLFAALVGAGRGAYKAFRGEIPISDLPAWFIVDLSIRGGLATAGKFGGALVGLVAIGPAGALVLGAVSGIAALLGTNHAHALVDRTLQADWHAAVAAKAADLRQALLDSLEKQASCLLQRQERFAAPPIDLDPDLAHWLDARALDDAIAAIECLDELPAPTDVNAAIELLVHAARRVVADQDVARTRHQLGEALRARPTVGQAIQQRASEMKQWALKTSSVS
jgi:hypothetical protein